MPRPKRTLVNAPPEKLFYVHGGGAVKNLFELKKAFEEMTDEQYDYHTGPGRNDFASWVKDVLGDAPTAKLLFGCIKRKTASKRAEGALYRYNLAVLGVFLPPRQKKEKKPKDALPLSAPTSSDSGGMLQNSSASPEHSEPKTPPPPIPPYIPEVPGKEPQENPLGQSFQ